MTKGTKVIAALLAAVMIVPAIPVRAAQPQEQSEDTNAVLQGGNVPETTRAVNPYLPLWEHIPDGEPRVFEDPDNPGKYRAYIYGSHDNQNNSTYCGYDHVVWSAPVEDLGNWRYEGISYQCGGLLYAPDVVEKDGKYYLYTYDLSHGNSVAVSDRPAGPFENMGEGGSHYGSGIGADPAILVDDDGRMYAYWGYQTYYQAEIDPETMKVKPGTTTQDAISNCNQEGDFQFYEGTSIRKVDGKYVMVYCQKPDKDPENGIIHDNYRARLAYAYSDNPLGPWTYGGPIIDNGGELLTNGKKSYPDGNVHGGIIEIQDQWYVFYHRMTNQSEFSRQAMMEPIEVRVDPAAGGNVEIKQAEMTSQGADSDGLDAYQHYDAGIACYLTEGAYITTDYSQTSGYNPVAGLKDGCVVGYKYIDFGAGAGEGEFLKVGLDIKTKGTAGRLDIFIDDPNNGTRKTDGTGTKIGSMEISGGIAQNFHVEETTLKNVTGKHALFFVFTSDSKDGEICEINGFEFSRETSLFQDDFQSGLGKWHVTGSPSAGSEGVALGAADSLYSKDGTVWEDYKTEISAVSGNPTVIFRRSDEKNYYQAEVSGSQIILSVIKNGSRHVLKTADFTRTEGQELKLSVSCAQDQITVRVNGAPVLQTTDGSWRRGGIGLAGTDGTVIRQVMVTETAVEETIRTDAILVNGKSLEGFNTDTQRYSVGLEKEEEIPVVTGVSTAENVRVSVAQAAEVPGAAVVKFVDEEETRTYIIDFYRKEVVTYDFTQGTLPEGWSVVNPKDTDTNITYSEQGVTVSADGADLPGTANQLQLDTPLEGDYQIDARMSLDMPLHQNWAKYGMSIYKDDGNAVIMDHEHDSRAKVQILWWKDTEWMTNGVSSAYDGKEIYFRLKKEGTDFTCLYSADGQNYTSVYTAQTDGRFEEGAFLRLFISRQNENNEIFKGTVEYVKVSSLGKKTDVPTDDNALEQLSLDIGTAMTVPSGDYTDAAAIAAKAAEILNARGDVKAAGAGAAVEVKGDRYTLTLTKDGKTCTTDPFLIAVEKTKDQLQALVDEAGELKETEYTSPSWDRMNYARERAEQVLEEETADSYAVAEAYDRLQSAFEGMEKVVSQTYRLTVQGGSGSGEYKEGEIVAITADKPAEGLVFDKWIVEGDVKIADASDQKTTITMPAHHTVVKASYKNKAADTAGPGQDKPDSTENGVSGKGKAPRTGDGLSAGVWTVMLAAAVVFIGYRRKRTY